MGKLGAVPLEPSPSGSPGRRPGPDPGAHSFFECSRHQARFVASVLAGRVPLKFAYSGSGAHAHDAYARSDHYHTLATSVPHEAETFLAAFRSGPAPAPVITEVVEIGPGNGEHSVALLECLRDGGLEVSRYLGLDFSRTLLEISEGELRSRVTDLAVETASWDVETIPGGHISRWRAGPGPLLVCLVGYTLGNFEDPGGALRNIAAACRPGDLLLATVVSPPSVASVADPSAAAYSTAIFRRAALEPLIAAGLSANEIEFTVNYRGGAFVGEVTLLRPADLNDRRLPAGYRFRCFLSRRFTRDGVIELFERSGWTVQPAHVAASSDHVTIVASRAEEST